jgi:hypothetical protein
VQVGLCTAAFNTYGLFLLAHSKFTKTVIGSVVVVEAFVVISGLVMHTITSSYVILAVAIFVPPGLFCLWRMYNRWVRDDYHVLPALLGKITLNVVRHIMTGIHIKVNARNCRSGITHLPRS